MKVWPSYDKKTRTQLKSILTLTLFPAIMFHFIARNIFSFVFGFPEGNNVSSRVLLLLCVFVSRSVELSLPSDEAETQARITDVYREPLDLDGLETLVLSILRTGRLTIQGTPGGTYMPTCMYYNYVPANMHVH